MAGEPQDLPTHVCPFQQTFFLQHFNFLGKSLDQPHAKPLLEYPVANPFLQQPQADHQMFLHGSPRVHLCDTLDCRSGRKFRHSTPLDGLNIRLYPANIRGSDSIDVSMCSCSQTQVGQIAPVLQVMAAGKNILPIPYPPV